MRDLLILIIILITSTKQFICYIYFQERIFLQQYKILLENNLMLASTNLPLKLNLYLIGLFYV